MSDQNNPNLLKNWATMPLDVVVELDRLSLSVREIASLAPGEIFRTRHSTKDPLTVMVGGVPVAIAERIESRRPRVRITRIQPPPEPSSCP